MQNKEEARANQVMEQDEEVQPPVPQPDLWQQLVAQQQRQDLQQAWGKQVQGAELATPQLVNNLPGPLLDPQLEGWLQDHASVREQFWQQKIK